MDEDELATALDEVKRLAGHARAMLDVDLPLNERVKFCRQDLARLVGETAGLLDRLH